MRKLTPLSFCLAFTLAMLPNAFAWGQAQEPERERIAAESAVKTQTPPEKDAPPLEEEEFDDDPISPIRHLATFTTTFEDDKGKSDTALVIITQLRQEKKEGISYGMDIRYLRLNKGHLEEFDKEFIPVDTISLVREFSPLIEAGYSYANVGDRTYVRTRKKYRYTFRTAALSGLKRSIHLIRDGETVRSLMTKARSTTPSEREQPSLDMSKPISVKGYYRKDGTYVRPHTRSRPTRRR